jgi:hypothetical protein
MTLSRKIVAALDARREPPEAPGVVEAQEGPHRLALHLQACGPVGLALDRLEYACTDRTDWSADELKQWGERLAGSLTYLMEPLVVLEVDPIGVEVELRSQLPTKREGCRAYYEARLDRHGVLRLGRSVFDESTRRRRPAACQLTREALERIADDLVASLP